jgi:transcription antitermination protein NusB
MNKINVETQNLASQTKTDVAVPSMRRKARSLALQAIYQWEYTNDLVDIIEAHFRESANPAKIDLDYFADLLHGVVRELETINSRMLPALERKIDEVNQVELAILRIAIYELVYRLDVPVKVVINESLELTKIFGSSEAFKFINGVLDKVAREIRLPTEFK